MQRHWQVSGVLQAAAVIAMLTVVVLAVSNLASGIDRTVGGIGSVDRIDAIA